MQITFTEVKMYFLLLIVYAFLGWCMEVLDTLVTTKKLVNRGFLIGPLCPIYGVGSILMTVLLREFTKYPVLLFFMAIVICGTLEYLTSYFMEKIFKLRWWDYSHKKYNLNGRVCLNTIVPFGLLGLFIIYVGNPFFLKIISGLPMNVLNIVFWVLLTVIFFDWIISSRVVGAISKTTKKVQKSSDNTEEITKKVKKILSEKSIFHKRFINAYPNISAIKSKIIEAGTVAKEEIKKAGETAKTEIKKAGVTAKTGIVKAGQTAKKEIINAGSTAKRKIIDTTNNAKKNIKDVKIKKSLTNKKDKENTNH